MADFVDKCAKKLVVGKPPGNGDDLALEVGKPEVFLVNYASPDDNLMLE